MKPIDNNDAIAQWMHQLSEDPTDPFSHPLQDPDLLWMKAQISNRQAEAQRILRPVVICDWISRGLIGFVVCWLALGAVRTFTPATGSVNPMQHSLYSLMLALVLVAATVAVHPIVSEE